MHKESGCKNFAAADAKIVKVLSAGELVRRVRVLDDVAREGEEGDDVGDDHELVEHIAHLPDELIGHRGAEENENKGEHGVDAVALLAEEVGHVDLAEEVVEKAKKNRQTATNILPALSPKTVPNALWARLVLL